MTTLTMQCRSVEHHHACMCTCNFVMYGLVLPGDGLVLPDVPTVAVTSADPGNLCTARTLDYSTAAMNIAEATATHVDASNKTEKTTTEKRELDSGKETTKRSSASIRVGDLLRKNKEARLAKLEGKTSKEALNHQAEGSVNKAVVSENTTQQVSVVSSTPQEILQPQPVVSNTPTEVPHQELAVSKQPENQGDEITQPKPVVAGTPADVSHQELAVSSQPEEITEPKPVVLKETETTDIAMSGPELPSDWGSMPYVTADTQQPPKPRGRKPKQPADGKAKAKAKTQAKSKAKAKAKHAPTANVEGDATYKKGKKRTQEATNETAEASAPEAPKKSRRKAVTVASSSSAAEPAQPTANAELELLPVPKQKQPMAKKITAKNKSKTCTTYEASEITEECNSFDAYALASAACDVANLDAAAIKKATCAPTLETGSVNVAHSRASASAAHTAEASSVADFAAPSMTAETSKGAKDAETKKRLSRKSCAYKKARNLALKAGKSQQEAAAAGKKATQIN